MDPESFNPPKKKARRYPFGKNNRELQIEIQTEEAARLQKEKPNTAVYNWKFKNSSLEGEGDASLSETFQMVLPDGSHGLKNYIESMLAQKKGRIVAVELGGIGSRLFAGFSERFIGRSLAISLTDYRTESERKSDSGRAHDVIAGDLFKEQTQKQALKWAGDDGVDLLFERLLGGIGFIPNEPYILIELLNKWYGALNDGGLMFIQVPTNLDPLMGEWLKECAPFASDVEIQYSRGFVDGNPMDASALRIRKRAGASKKVPQLPLLHPRVVKKISEDIR